MEKENINLCDKYVGDIRGDFSIPSYQRGYRWGSAEVTALLDDIYESEGKSYCLQPVVVRRKGEESYELIDGQQRLTTIYILYKYLQAVLPILNAKFKLEYVTRGNSGGYLEGLENSALIDEDPDSYYMHKAYNTVKEWFSQKCGEDDNLKISTAMVFNSCFTPSGINKDKGIGVKVIWYELIDSTDEEAIKLFTRLNIGRIPLTNAELVKALFLSRTEGRGKVTEEWQREVSLQWDTIERELHDKDFWYFLTTERAEERDTRIELILDFMAKEEIDKTPKDPYASFIWFNNKSKEGDLRELWNEITRFYSTLKEWYKKDELYHRIGYLVASKTKKIDDLMEAVKGLKKSEIIEKLDGFIRESIKTGEKDYSELSYENDYDKVSRLLLLFNVVSLMKSGGKARFPFKEYNTSNWSLEHIHAQQSEGLKTQDEWKTWIGEHKQSVEAIASMSEDENKKKQADVVLNLIAEKESAELSGEEFEGIKGQIIQLLSEGSDVDYVHRLSNMALLQKEKNSALNNVVFDAKRRRIIKMDKKGEYIPYCTKMVFMKYYTQNVTDRLSVLFWGEEDRKAYIENMNEVLSDYLEGKKIEL